jgi:tryptophan synthase alpha chain
MESNLTLVFNKIRKEGKKAFIPYIMAGDPSLEDTADIIGVFEEIGADIIEVGVPFSDPLADGPTIQRASERALSNRVTLKKVLSFTAGLKLKKNTPIVLMSYFNPIFKMGINEFIKCAKASKIDGIIIPDLPPDEAGEVVKYSKEASIDTIFLLAPTSTEDRIRKVVRLSSGFIYYVSITGITGSKLLLDGSMEELISKVRSYTRKPIAVGFGISKPEEASIIANVADGVIVGSAIIKKIHEARSELKDYLLSLRSAIR